MFSRTDGVQAAETWVVNLIRNARLNAKIDSKVRADLQQPVCMFQLCSMPCDLHDTRPGH